MEYCVNCDEHIDPLINERKVEFTYEEDKIRISEYYLTCPVCGSEIYSGIINDINCRIRQREVEFYKSVSV